MMACSPTLYDCLQVEFFVRSLFVLIFEMEVFLFLV